MGAGFEQGSVFHVQGDLVDAEHLSNCADLLMTTSPNVMDYTAIDGWRRDIVASGTEILGRTLDLASDVRSQIDDLAGLFVMARRLLRREASHDLDRLQVLIDVSELGISGYRLLTERPCSRSSLAAQRSADQPSAGTGRLMTTFRPNGGGNNPGEKR